MRRHVWFLCKSVSYILNVEVFEDYNPLLRFHRIHIIGIGYVFPYMWEEESQRYPNINNLEKAIML